MCVGWMSRIDLQYIAGTANVCSLASDGFSVLFSNICDVIGLYSIDFSIACDLPKLTLDSLPLSR